VAWTGLVCGAVGGIGLVTALGAGPTSEGWVHVCCDREPVARVQDARVTAALIDESHSLPTTERLRVLSALAMNTGLTPEGELKLIEATASLPSSDRASVLATMARVVRVERVERDERGLVLP
jgi:NAD(P)-dependent dehydrogenase (short-subunit alcohol dehydrogenase family)